MNCLNFTFFWCWYAIVGMNFSYTFFYLNSCLHQQFFLIWIFRSSCHRIFTKYSQFMNIVFMKNLYKQFSTCFALQLHVPLCEQMISSCNPSTSTTVTLGNLSAEPSFMRFGERLFSRPIDIICLPNIFTKQQLFAVSDSGGGKQRFSIRNIWKKFST